MTIPEVSVDELATILTNGAQVVDVREPAEYEEAHLPGARLVPLGTVPQHVDVFSGDGTTYVVCRSGGRSMQACEFLAGQGLDVANVAGGMLAWVASGRDIESGAA